MKQVGVGVDVSRISGKALGSYRSYCRKSRLKSSDEFLWKGIGRGHEFVGSLHEEHYSLIAAQWHRMCTVAENIQEPTEY